MVTQKRFSTIMQKLDGKKIQIAVVNNESKPESGNYTVFSWSGTVEEEKGLKVMKTVREVVKEYNQFRSICKEFP